MQRPASIITFERAYLAAFALGLVNTALLMPAMLARFDAMTNARGGMATRIEAVIGAVIGSAIMLALWYFAARRASNVAKWGVVAIFALTVGSLLWGLSRGEYPHGLIGGLVVVVDLLQALAVAMLFRPDAREWFERGRGAGIQS